jgi:hypothetical protein
MSFLSYTEITTFEHTSLVLIVGIWKENSYEPGLQIRFTLNCSYQYWLQNWFLGGMNQICAWYWNWYKADIYHNTLAALTQIKLLFRNAKSFKTCFSQREIFCEGKYKKPFDIIGNVLFLKMKSSKLSNYFSLDFRGMEKYFLFQLLHVCKLTSVLETANLTILLPLDTWRLSTAHDQTNRFWKPLNK